jgi:hypothetical protein
MAKLTKALRRVRDCARNWWPYGQFRLAGSAHVVAVVR